MAIHRRRRGGGVTPAPPRAPIPPLFPFQFLRLTARILLRRLRCQEDLSLTIFGPPSVGNLRGPQEEGDPSQTPRLITGTFTTQRSPPVSSHGASDQRPCQSSRCASCQSLDLQCCSHEGGGGGLTCRRLCFLGSNAALVKGKEEGEGGMGGKGAPTPVKRARMMQRNGKHRGTGVQEPGHDGRGAPPPVPRAVGGRSAASSTAVLRIPLDRLLFSHCFPSPFCRTAFAFVSACCCWLWIASHALLVTGLNTRVPRGPHQNLHCGLCFLSPLGLLFSLNDAESVCRAVVPGTSLSTWWLQRCPPRGAHRALCEKSALFHHR